MSIGSQREYRLTQSKLTGVQEMIAKVKSRPSSSPAVRAASLRPLDASATN